MNKKRGFTLVELMAVIVIIAILLVILVPTISKVASSARISMKDSKINIIKTAAEKFGNEAINKYQKCTGELNSEALKNDCTVSIQDLIKHGYVESDKDESLIDPVTNKAMEGKALLCFDPNNVKITASYVENEGYECALYDLKAGVSLMLENSKGVGYINGEDLKIKFSSHGSFTGFECSASDSRYVTSCNISNKTMTIEFAKNGEGLDFNDERFKDIDITLKGRYKDKDTGTNKTLTRTLSLQVYSTSLSISESEQCMPVNTTEEIILTAVNTNSFQISSEPEGIIGTYISGNILRLSSYNKTGIVNINIRDTKGGAFQSISKKIYDYRVDIDEDKRIVLNTNKKFSITHAGVGSVTVSSSDKNILMLSLDGKEEQESIKIDTEGTHDLFIHAKGEGDAEIAVTPDDYCAKEIKHMFNVSNMSLKESEMVTFAGSKEVLTNEILASSMVDMKCVSSNPNAATCKIEGTYLKIIPGLESDENVTITVSGPYSGYASMKLQVLPTSISLEDKDGNNVTYVCNELGSVKSEKDIYLKGTNIDNVEVSKDDLLVTTSILDIDGEERRKVNISNTNVLTEPFSPYKTGYNTGKTTLRFTETRGNQSVALDAYIYSLNLLTTDTSEVLHVGETTDFDVQASMSGDVGITISNPNVVDAYVEAGASYQEGINTYYTRTIKITGKSVGEAEIIVRGSRCGEKKYKIRVEPFIFRMNFEAGLNTESIGDEVKECLTTGENTTCEIEVPTINPIYGFEATGYGLDKNSLEVKYHSGSKITLNKDNTNQTLYGISSDLTRPTCEFTNIPKETKVENSVQIDLSCHDYESGLKEFLDLGSNNFVSNDNVAFTSITKEEREGEYIYHINLETKQTGVLKLALKANTIQDNFNNMNEETSFNGIVISDEEGSIETWNIGKINDDDVIAAIYENGENSHTLKIFGEGDFKDFVSESYNYYAPWYNEYRETITDIFIDNKVTNVGSYAFSWINNIKNVKLSDNTTYIGRNAFVQCSLTEIDLPGKLVRIGKNAFAYNNIESLTIPASVEVIEEQAFVNLSLESSDTQGKLKTLLFEENSKLKTIDKQAFANHALTSITFPASVEVIGDNAFSQDNTSLHEVTFLEDSKLVSIGNFAFSGTELTKFNLPPSVCEIGDLSISVLDGIDTVKLGKNLRFFGEAAITGKKLINFEIDPLNPYFSVVDGILYNKNQTELIKCPDSYGRGHPEINIPSTVQLFREGSLNAVLDYDTSISWPTFNIPAGVTNINIDNNFEGFSVGGYSFNNDNYTSSDGILYNKDKTVMYLIPTGYSKTDLIIPESVREIYSLCGYMNFKIKNITLPSNVKKIGSSAFLSDSKYSFASIEIEASEDFIDDGAFGLLDYDNMGFSSRTVLVPNNNILDTIMPNYRYCKEYATNDNNVCLQYEPIYDTLTIKVK